MCAFAPGCGPSTPAGCARSHGNVGAPRAARAGFRPLASIRRFHSVTVSAVIVSSLIQEPRWRRPLSVKPGQ